MPSSPCLRSYPPERASSSTSLSLLEASSSSAAPSHRKWRPRRLEMGRVSPAVLVLLALFTLWSGANAVLVSSFSNCLPASTRESETHVQFHPILVAAELAGSGGTELAVTVWGLTTGRSSTEPGKKRKRALVEETIDEDANWTEPWMAGGLVRRAELLGSNLTRSDIAPPTYWDSNYEDSKDRLSALGNFNYETTGSILDSSTSWNTVATALYTNIKLATWDVDSNRRFLCEGHKNNSVMAPCPLGSKPVMNYSKNWTDVEYLLSDDVLDSFTWRKTLPNTYTFSTLAAEFKIVTGDKAATKVGCIKVEITPILSDSNSNTLIWVPAGVLILMGISTVLAAMFNPWSGTTSPWRWTSNYGMDVDMIRLVTPGFGDCLAWLQFIVLTGSLSLRYPGFYQPIVSKGAWSILLVNTSFWSFDTPDGAAWKGDGIYALEAWKQGFERMAQAVGLQTTSDIWVSVIAWFAALLMGLTGAIQVWFWGRWTIRKVMGLEDADLTKRNWPFTAGMLNRLAFRYFYVPVLAASIFQLVNHSHSTLIIIAVLVIIGLLSILAFLMWRIWRTNPHETLFDDLSTLLTYGTFYNTLQEKQLRFFIFQYVVDTIRAVVIGGLQASGTAQLSILACCEVATLMTIQGMRPWARETSMNLETFIFTLIRLLTILLMLPFVEEINTGDETKSFLGWVILLMHAVVLVFGFVFQALQTILEVAVRGFREDEDAARQRGLVKVFGVRQLSRRKRTSKTTVRSSSITPTPTILNDRRMTMNSSRGQLRPRSRSGSSAILLGSPAASEGMALAMPPDGSQTGHQHSNSGSTVGSPAFSRLSHPGLRLDTGAVTDPYYRPPRTKGAAFSGEGYSPVARNSRGSWGSEVLAAGGLHRSSQGSLPASALMNVANGEDLESPDAATPRGHRYTDSQVTVGSNRGNTDYAVREVDFYYGVARGPALNDTPVRRLGTGPADPTGPISTAKSWLKQKLGIAKREQERGFSVVRSSRAPPDAMLEAQEAAAEGEEGEGEGVKSDDENAIGVAVTSPDIREPASDSESESDREEESGPNSRMLEKRPKDREEAIELERRLSRKPTVPRKSSKRKSRTSSGMLQEPPDSPVQARRPDEPYDPHLTLNDDERPISAGPANSGPELLSTSRLPFQQPAHLDHSRSDSTASSLLAIPDGAFDEHGIGRPASVGEVRHHRVTMVPQEAMAEDFRGSKAELVRGGSQGSRGSLGSWEKGDDRRHVR